MGFTIVLVIVAAIALVLLLALRKPDHFAVERSTVIQAPPEKIFPLINDFRRWPVWSPYEKLDPNMTRTISGPGEGKGALYAWRGNGKAGAGEMEILDSMSPSLVSIALRFTKPFKCENRVRFALDRTDGGTRVTWRMEGPAKLFSKVMQVFMDMDKMCGASFDAGLAAMKSATES